MTIRISEIEIEGFRGFSDSLRLDLNADTLLLAGPNGRGKTSLLDSILWGLMGRLPRLGKNQDAIISKYGPGSAYVNLTLESSDGDVVVIRRTREGDDQRVHLNLFGEELSGESADVRITEFLGTGRGEGPKSLDTC